MHAREDVSMQRAAVVRYLLNGLGVIDLLMFLAGIHTSGMLLTLGLFALFLGITDFGRLCPLILSARHLAYQLRSKGKPPILSAKPIEEISKSDRNNILS
jgi:hypothetical protein